jgi:AcrR family transcriptional regulator
MLFARQGFHATSVGEIEAAVGLQPRRGALYKHFPNKAALLEAAVERFFEQMQSLTNGLDLSPDMNPGSATLHFGRWMITMLDAQRDLTHILEREGERLKPLQERYRAIIDFGFASAALAIERWLQSSGTVLNPSRSSVILVGAIVNFRRSNWTFGAAPLGLEDEAFLEELAAMVEQLVTG